MTNKPHTAQGDVAGQERDVRLDLPEPLRAGVCWHGLSAKSCGMCYAEAELVGAPTDGPGETRADRDAELSRADEYLKGLSERSADNFSCDEDCTHVSSEPPQRIQWHDIRLRRTIRAAPEGAVIARLENEASEALGRLVKIEPLSGQWDGLPSKQFDEALSRLDRAELHVVNEIRHDILYGEREDCPMCALDRAKQAVIDAAVDEEQGHGTPTSVAEAFVGVIDIAMTVGVTESLEQEQADDEAVVEEVPLPVIDRVNLLIGYETDAVARSLRTLAAAIDEINERERARGPA